MHRSATPRLLPFLLLAVTSVLHASGREWWIDGATIIVGDPGRPRVVTGSVLLKGGLIAWVGEGNPADAGLAERLDGAGLVVHPAWIDAYTSLGVPAPRFGESAEPPRDAGPLPATDPDRRAGLAASRRIADEWQPEARALDAHRRSGFAAAHVVGGDAAFSGATSLVALAGGGARERVLSPFVGHGVSFWRQSAYPGSLMGSVAFLRQTLLDARHHRETRILWSGGTRGLVRPAWDPELAALEGLVTGERRAWWNASSRGFVRRALAVGREFDLRSVVAGGLEAHFVAEELARERVSVVLVPPGGERPPASAPGVPSRESARRVSEWDEDAAGASVLALAGVPIAFGSGDRGDPARLVARVKECVERGLDPDAAMRALTLGAAEILGVAEMLGSIEVGKIANVVVREAVEGGPFAKQSPIRWIFIDGERFEVEPARETKADAEAPPANGDETPSAEGTKEGVREEKTTEGDAPAAAEPATELDVDRVPSLRTGGRVLVRGATLLASTGESPRVADLRVVDGRIEAMGSGLEAPDGMPTIDASGWFVMPGIVDCHSHLATDGGVNEATESITCEVRIRDVLDPFDIGLYRAAAGGCTTSNILHGSANTIGGQNAVIRNLYRSSVEELLFPDAPVGVKFALGENVRRRGDSGRFPRSRMGVEAVMRRAFAAAREYREAAAEYGERIARGERLYPPRRDLRLETLLEIVEGRRLVHTHCYRADEILRMLAVAEEYGLRLATLQHVLEGYRVAPEIAAAGVGASTFSDWWAYKIEAYDAIPHNSALLARAGVVTSVNSDDAEMVRHLHHEAAKQVRSGGMSHEEALRLITINPARQLGIDGRVGTLEIGKDADLAIFDTHPLSIFARVRYTLIRGEVVFERRDESRSAARPAALADPVVDDRTVDVPENIAGVYVLRGGRVIPVSGAPIDRGTVVIADGRIAAVGPADRIEVPAGATVIDTTGRFVLPGLIDAGAELGLIEIDSVDGSVDTREIGRAQPDIAAASGFNIHSELVAVTRAGGITSTVVMNRGPLIAGRASWMRLEGPTSRDATRSASVALHIDLPRIDPADKEPAVRRELADWFHRAKLWAEARRAADERGAPEPDRDEKLEALAPFAEGRGLVVFAADDEASIRFVLALVDELELRGAIRGGRDAWKLAAELGKRGVPVIVGPVHALPGSSWDPYDAPYANPGRLHAAGVPIAFQTRDAALVRNLPYHAGTAVAFGLPYESAIEALTLGAARIFGLDGEVGSLDVGKRADVIVVDGDPLELTARVSYVFIDGVPVSLDHRHRRHYREFRERVDAAPRRRDL